MTIFLQKNLIPRGEEAEDAQSVLNHDNDESLPNLILLKSFF